MRVFVSRDNYHIRGYGTVFLVALDKESTREELNALLGQTVAIDGRYRKIRALELHARLGSFREGEPIGLLVSEQE